MVALIFFYAVLDHTTFPNNKAGELATVNFSLPDRYDGTVYCPNSRIYDRALTYFLKQRLIYLLLVITFIN